MSTTRMLSDVEADWLRSKQREIDEIVTKVVDHAINSRDEAAARITKMASSYHELAKRAAWLEEECQKLTKLLNEAQKRALTAEALVAKQGSDGVP